MSYGKPLITTAAAMLIGSLMLPLAGQDAALEKPADTPPAAIAAGQAEESLVDKQDLIALKFKRFEKTLLQLARYMRKSDPQRADLLVRAIGQSKEGRISQQMDLIVRMLESQRLGDAIERQSELVVQLKSLLKLLQSEDRKSEIEKEKKRIKDLLKDLSRIIAKEKDVRATTERGDNPQRLAGRQQKLAQETGRLVKKIDGQDAQKYSEAGEGKPDEGKPDEGKPGEGKPGEGKPGEGKPGEGKPGEGKPGEGKSGDKDGRKRTAGRDEIERAREDMQRAIEELKRRNHDKASGHQDEALAKLQAAKEKLEEILRQLREEERELLLAALEARFQKMLAMQLLVYQSTVSLDKTPKKEWAGRHYGRTRELSTQEDEIAIEAAKALTLLKEEGSSVAFPETVEQIRGDVLTVARRLENGDVGELTQLLERDIIEALEEAIEALQKEMEKSDKEGKPSDRNGDPTLVDKLAELKMLRSLQLRINRRTKRLGRLIRGEQATEADVVGQLQELARRQDRIQQAAYDLATGKNR